MLSDHSISFIPFVDMFSFAEFCESVVYVKTNLSLRCRIEVISSLDPLQQGDHLIIKCVENELS